MIFLPKELLINIIEFAGWKSFFAFQRVNKDLHITFTLESSYNALGKILKILDEEFKPIEQPLEFKFNYSHKFSDFSGTDEHPFFFGSLKKYTTGYTNDEPNLDIRKAIKGKYLSEMYHPTYQEPSWKPFFVILDPKVTKIDFISYFKIHKDANANQNGLNLEITWDIDYTAVCFMELNIDKKDGILYGSWGEYIYS